MPKGVVVVIINSNSQTYPWLAANTTPVVNSAKPVRAFFQKLVLRDVTIEEFNAVAHELDPIVAKRVRHILTENARTVEALARWDEAARKRDYFRLCEKSR